MLSTRFERLRTGVLGGVRPRTFLGVLAEGGTQNFLGAPWVAAAVTHSPRRWQRWVALRLLGLSPHYFFAPDLEAEDARMRSSRAKLVDELLSPYLGEHGRVVDFGCGPGYAAVAAADRAQSVEAVDISRGVLACAAVLNSGANIDYETPAQFAERDGKVDFIYSFHVVQHMRESDLEAALSMLRRRLEAGGRIALHFTTCEQGWRTEEEWQRDKSLRGRLRLRIGLNCFGRSGETMTDLLERAGFCNVSIESLDGKTSLGDVAEGSWAIALPR